MSVLKAQNIYKLERQHFFRLFEMWEAEDWKLRNKVANKAHDWCHKNVPGYQRRALELQNAMLRALNHNKPWDSRQYILAMNMAEYAAWAEQAEKALDPIEFRKLTLLLFTALEQVADEPEAKDIWTAPTGAEDAQEAAEEESEDMAQDQSSEPPRSPQEIDAWFASLEGKPPKKGGLDVEVVQDGEAGAYFIGGVPPAIEPGEPVATENTDPFEDWLS